MPSPPIYSSPAHRRAPLFALLIAALPTLFAGCVPAASGGGVGNTAPLTRNEIRVVGVQDAYELLVRTRPGWLRTSGGALLLYLDQTRVAQGSGVREYLQNFNIGYIREVRWIPAEEAADFPMAPPGNIRGAIQILTGEQ